jgi:S1-C subfamily serine protease
MTICPQCGYVRKKSDSIISDAECPKCGIIYSKWQNKPAGENLPSSTGLSQEIFAEKGVKKKTSIERLVIYAAVAVVFIALIHSLVVPFIIKQFRSEKNASDPSATIESSAAMDDQVSGKARSTNSPSVEYNPALHQRELSITDIIRSNRNSIVVVRTASGIGSGFFINREGYIVTNRHVLSKAGRAEIKTAAGHVFRVLQIIQEDSEADLVIASTDATAQESNPVTLSSRLPEVGEKIIVIGNPMGLEQTVSDGIVSAVRRNQYAVDFIQVTAPVSAGNSGGPLLNMRGEVIGVATFQYRSGQNLNFCVAASRISALQQGSSSYGVSSGGDVQSPGGRDVYCYADSGGQVSFVDWKTGMLVSRPDGSLDRVKFEKWVLEQIGGNPENINPERDARDDVERNREQLFKSVFPHRSMSDTNLTGAEKDWLDRRYQRHYVEAYNQSMSRRNDAVRKYHAMMNTFDRFNATRRP